MMPISVLLWLLCGLVLGAAYLFLIGRSVAAIMGDGNWRAAALPFFLRMALAVAGFVFAAINGAMPVLSMLTGFLIARSIGLRHVRES